MALEILISMEAGFLHGFSKHFILASLLISFDGEFQSSTKIPFQHSKGNVLAMSVGRSEHLQWIKNPDTAEILIDLALTNETFLS